MAIVSKPQSGRECSQTPKLSRNGLRDHTACIADFTDLHSDRGRDCLHKSVPKIDCPQFSCERLLSFDILDFPSIVTRRICFLRASYSIRLDTAGSHSECSAQTKVAFLRTA